VSDLANNAAATRLTSHIEKQLVKVILTYVTAQKTFDSSARSCSDKGRNGHGLPLAAALICDESEEAFERAFKKLTPLKRATQATKSR
jgi:hypothetical protein